MKKILFFLFAFLAFQYTVAQSIFERKSIGNNVYVSTNTSEKKAESIRNFSFAEESYEIRGAEWRMFHHAFA